MKLRIKLIDYNIIKKKTSLNYWLLVLYSYQIPKINFY